MPVDPTNVVEDTTGRASPSHEEEKQAMGMPILKLPSNVAQLIQKDFPYMFKDQQKAGTGGENP